MQNQISVLKFGGNTLVDPAHIKRAAKTVAEKSREGKKVIVVVSAMGATTDELIKLAMEVSPQPHRREYDMLISAGERVSMSLLTMALHDLGLSAISFTGSQAGILTTDSYSQAKIKEVKPIRIEAELKNRDAIVIAGFQGVSPKTKDVTTLGRGGTDTTAVALAAHFNAEECSILKDVPGVFSADPKLVPSARLIPRLSLSQCSALTFWGAGFLHHRAAKLAERLKVNLTISSALESNDQITSIESEDDMYEKDGIVSVTCHKELLKTLSVDKTGSQLIDEMDKLTKQGQCSMPTLLQSSTMDGKDHSFWLWKEDSCDRVKEPLAKSDVFTLDDKTYSTVSAITNSSGDTDIYKDCVNILNNEGIGIVAARVEQNAITFVVESGEADKSVKALHSLIPLAS